MKFFDVAMLAALALLHLKEIQGHGMLMEPINRASMWRRNYRTPINYDDNENFCGGYGVQWLENGGKCGLCGDDYSLSRPRPNENTGTYGTGIIVAKYEEGSEIDLAVLLTANHRGNFQFSLCPLSSPDELEEEECFEAYPLILKDGSEKYTLTDESTGLFNVTVKLPQGLTCDHCVLRWHYTTGNNWGRCDDGTGATGCGPQENFRTCTDIAITSGSRKRRSVSPRFQDPVSMGN